MQRFHWKDYQNFALSINKSDEWQLNYKTYTKNIGIPKIQNRASCLQRYAHRSSHNRNQRQNHIIRIEAHEK